MGTFGEKLVTLRESKGLTQKKLAELLDITPTRLNYWEKDKRQPDIVLVKKIASVLDIPVSYLMNWDEVYNPDGKLEMEVKLIEEIEKHFGREAVTLLQNFTSLNELGQSKAVEYLSDLADQEKYIKESVQNK